MAKTNNGAALLKKQKREIERELNKFSRRAAVEAKNFFKNSFRIGGFVDMRYTRWRKRKRRDFGRAILVKTGNLRDSIKSKLLDNYQVEITSDTKYGKFHNDGTSKLPKRQFIGNSYQLNRKITIMIERMLSKGFR